MGARGEKVITQVIKQKLHKRQTPHSAQTDNTRADLLIEKLELFRVLKEILVSSLLNTRNRNHEFLNFPLRFPCSLFLSCSCSVLLLGCVLKKVLGDCLLFWHGLGAQVGHVLLIKQGEGVGAAATGGMHYWSYELWRRWTTDTERELARREPERVREDSIHPSSTSNLYAADTTSASRVTPASWIFQIEMSLW